MKITDEILKELEYLKDKAKTQQERKRAHALVLWNNGKSKDEIAEIFGVSKRTIYNWINDFKATAIESLAIKKGRGRKPLLNTDSDKKIIKEQIEEYPHQPKRAYALSLENLPTTISYKTFQRYLKKHSISATNG